MCDNSEANLIMAFTGGIKIWYRCHDRCYIFIGFTGCYQLCYTSIKFCNRALKEFPTVLQIFHFSI